MSMRKAERKEEGERERKGETHRTYRDERERIRGNVKTCVEKRVWRLERAREVRGESECGLRGPHGVVKSIRPGLEPRLLALLTAVRRERHQRD